MLFERLLHLLSNLPILFSRYAIFLSLSVSGTQQTARMNDLGHGIDPHAVLPRLACQYSIHTQTCHASIWEGLKIAAKLRPWGRTSAEQKLITSRGRTLPNRRQSNCCLLHVAIKNTTSTSFQTHCNTVNNILQDIQHCKRNFRSLQIRGRTEL